MNRRRTLGFAAAVMLSATGGAGVAGAAGTSKSSVTKYDWKSAAEYDSKWSALFGPGEGTRTFKNNEVGVAAAPFTTSADFGVFDHLKYIRTSSESFAVPTTGSLEFSVDVTAKTPGTQPGRVVHGCYGLSGSWNVGEPCAHPFSQIVEEGQQAGVVLNMINFQTGQLFDWFVSDNEVFALIERLPTVVTGSPGVGLDKAYTQIIKVGSVRPGSKQKLGIRYTRGPGVSMVEYFLNEKLFARVDHVGVPLDRQGVPFTGYSPSLGAGGELSLDSFNIGHGLFSLLDAFPYQHPDRPDLSVSIPISERLFGQGAIGTWKNFQVTTKSG